ncbi:putative manganese-transporting ATPase PDR2, partial [Bienertia sinuspersici]
MKKEMKHAQVFIPIVASGHYYLLYINFMKGSLELIDNRLLDNKISFVQKYKNHFRTLSICNFLSNFPLNKETKNMFEEICNFKTKTLNMKWRSNDNYDDCGIYSLLKHMETYHGEKDK